MSADRPNETAQIFDGDKELERAILDSQMKEFEAEIKVNLADFSGYKEELLSLLRDANDCGTETKPFDRDKSWLRIETTAYQYFAREKVKQNVMKSADHEARYRTIADAVKTARSMIAEVRQLDFAGYLIKEWLEGTRQLADATEQYEGLLYIEVKLDEVTKSLVELEVAAKQVADEAHKGRGRPKGSSVLPWNLIYALAGDYRWSTGLKPGRGDGPFARFVVVFLTAVGKGDINKLSLIDAIKDAPAHRLRDIKGVRPSPFDD